MDRTIEGVIAVEPPVSLDSLFREAVSAMDAGDVTALERLLADHPRLVSDRLDSPGDWLRDVVGGALDGFFREPYLLWFVAEDPVRQGKMPANIAEVTRTLLRAAEREGVDTLPEQLAMTLHLAVCSSVERKSGLQIELIDTLIDGGASPDRTIDCFVNGNFAAAEQLLKRGAELNLAAAVCLGLWEDASRLALTASAREKQVALVLAALNGRARALSLLIEHGVDLDAYSTDIYTHATALHHAVWSGSLDAVKVIVEAGARLDTKDTANQATPLGWAEYAGRGKDERSKRYEGIADYLREKGAP